MKYAFIHRHRQAFSIQRMCHVVGVARSGYYAWRQREGASSPKRSQQAIIDQHVAKAYHQRKGRSGAPRLTLDLRDDGMPINRKTVAASLQRQGLRAKAARKFKATTNSRHSLPVAPNLLEQNFTASAPNQKWVGDITYLATGEGWLYLAVLIDLYSRKVVGWAMSERMTADLVCDALQMALWRRKMPKGVIVHSDRGSQGGFNRSTQHLDIGGVTWEDHLVGSLKRLGEHRCVRLVDQASISGVPIAHSGSE